MKVALVALLSALALAGAFVSGRDYEYRHPAPRPVVPTSPLADAMPAMLRDAQRLTCDAQAIALTIERCIAICGRPNPSRRGPLDVR